MRDRFDRDRTSTQSVLSSGSGTDRSNANLPTKWSFHGELSNFILYDTYGTGAFWFRDAKGTPRLFVVFLTQDPAPAKPDGFLRYSTHNAEGGVARWAFYVGGTDSAAPAGGDMTTSVSTNAATAQSRGAVYLWLADPSKKKEWHLYEEATRQRGQ
jgi:hypothetical protein